jgi:hypothetical protein
MARRVVASLIWGAGAALTIFGLFSHPGDLTGDAAMIGLGLITGYNLFLGNQRGHIAHILLACCFVVITGLHAIPWQLSAVEIAAVAAPTLVVAGICVVLFRRDFYEDYFGGKKRNHFS